MTKTKRIEKSYAYIVTFTEEDNSRHIMRVFTTLRKAENYLNKMAAKELNGYWETMTFVLE